MARDDKYFQFPLVILQGDDANTTRVLCQSIVNHGIAHCASDPQRQRLREKLEYDENVIDTTGLGFISDRAEEAAGFSVKGVDEAWICVAANYLNVRLGNRANVKPILKILRSPAKARSTMVRLRTDLLWDIHDQDWNNQMAKTLIGVYAGIGADKSKWISWSHLQALSAGFGSMRQVIASGGESKLASEKSIRYWENRLWDRGFFQQCTMRNRRYFSKSLPNDQALRKYLEKLDEYNKKKKPVRVREVVR